ncbi:MAG: RNA-binding S4 domain-containing protein [Bacteroidales bacterium]|nr:RNA-binding S4 domain-containing protein [Bacteroidales bacterium]
MIFKIRQDEEFIPLIQLLKATNIAENGSIAQELVNDGMVKRNGQVEYRKRAKIRREEKIEVLSQTIIVE